MVCIHGSKTLSCDMKFAIYLPSATEKGIKLPVLYFLNDFGANESTVFEQTNIQKYAEQYKIIVLSPDTGPRGHGMPGDCPDIYFGTGASFYLDAVIPPYINNYRMHTYLNTEFRPWIERKFPCIDGDRAAVSGLGMGGGGALVCFLRNPQIFKAVSAFGPLANPSREEIGIRCFQEFLGPESKLWKEFDATELVKMQPQRSVDILLDVGMKDGWASTTKPMSFINACNDMEQTLTVKERTGYDHNMYFVKTFIGEHMKHFAKILYPPKPGPSY